MTYSLAGISSSPFHPNQPSSLGTSYPNGHLACCFGAPYGTPTYLLPPMTNGFNGESKHYTNNNNNPSVIQTNSLGDETEAKAINESPQDENNESENKSQSSSSSSSSNDGNTNSEQVITESHDEKRRDSNPVGILKIKKRLINFFFLLESTTTLESR